MPSSYDTRSYGAPSLNDVGSQSEYHSVSGASHQQTSCPKKFANVAKRRISRDPIASDSDARDIQALAKFLCTKEPSPSSFTSQPEVNDSRGSSVFRMRLGHSRRSSGWSLRSSKTGSTSKKPLQLPDSAVAMRTTKGGHWHIAICVPETNPGSFVPHPDNPAVQTIGPGLPCPPEVRDTVQMNSKSGKTAPFSTSRYSIRSSVVSCVAEKLHLRQAKVVSVATLPKIPTTAQSILLNAPTFEEQKYEIAAAIARWEKGSSESDVQSLRQRLATLAMLENKACTSGKNPPSISDADMDLWNNRAMSVDSEVSAEVGTLRNKRHSIMAPSERTIKQELSLIDMQTESAGEFSSAASPSDEYVSRRRGSIETIRTQRKERVSAIRKRDILAVQQTSSQMSSNHREAIVQKDTSHQEILSMHNSEATRLWQPQSNPRHLAKSPERLPIPIPSLKLWQPTSSTSTSPSKSEPESENKSAAFWSTVKPAFAQSPTTTSKDAAPAKDAHIVEISKCLTELQRQNAIMMQALVAVTNIHSGHQDMALLAEKFGKRTNVVTNEMVMSNLIDC